MLISEVHNTVMGRRRRRRLLLLILTIVVAGSLPRPSLSAAGNSMIVNVNENEDLILMEKVPEDVTRYSWSSGQPFQINSTVPVSVFRYNDDGNVFLVDGLPIGPYDLYVVIKMSGNCLSTNLTPVIEYTDTNRFPRSMSISFPEDDGDDDGDNPNDMTTATAEFLDPSSFNVTWDYVSYWCQERIQETETAAPSTETIEPTASPTVSGSSTRTRLGPSLIATVISVVFGVMKTMMMMTENNNDLHQKQPRRRRTSMILLFVGTLLFVTLWVGSSTMYPDSVGAAAVESHHSYGLHHADVKTKKSMNELTMKKKTVTKNQNVQHVSSFEIQQQQQHQQPSQPQRQRRQLQAKDDTKCTVGVEMLLDGCETSVIVVAPAIRVMDGEIENLTQMQNPDDQCTTDYAATLVFNLVAPASPTTTTAVGERQEQDLSVAIVNSFGPDSDRYDYCFRDIEGRPFIDANGRQLQATRGEAENDSDPTWSKASTTSTKDGIDSTSSIDKELGRQWLQRALGEHASVPAFAAFVIALMSNNAPPDLIEDALSAAQDEVNHAKTSFEIASILLGETVEPSALPPSNHTFGPNLTELVVATAREGCVDETLSALAAGLEVEYEIDQNRRIDDHTNRLLKSKIRTIAIEETQHSVLTWRTVQWACRIDSVICSNILRNQVFVDDYLDRTFAKRFHKYPKDVSERVLEHFMYIVTNNMKALLSNNAVDSDNIGCNESMTRYLEENSNVNDSFVEYLSRRIVHDFTCPSP